jgi:glycosyltransferase involved in cell wall biosynthesis
MKLAVVVPIYNEEDNLPELSRRLAEACGRVEGARWQVIYVDDGSTDKSAAVVMEQHRADPRFTLVQLSRNFGPYPALSAGLAHADADAVVTIDGDLQDPPEVIPDLVACWKEGGQVILAARRSRQDRGIRRIGAEVFHKIFGVLNDFRVPANTGIFGLLDRQAVEEFNRLPERNRYVPGLRHWIGFDRRVVYYDRLERARGAPKQSLRRLIHLALDSIFSFSYKPLKLMMVAGIAISSTAFLIAVMYMAKRLLGYETAPLGFTTLVTLVAFLGGIQLIAIGLLGQYLGRIYDEVKQRPLYIVRQRVGVSSARDPGRERRVDS